MITNNETMEAELENPCILICNKKLANIQELIPALNSVASTGRPILIIADDFADDILGTMIYNRMKSGFISVAVKSPSYGENRKRVLDDIAILCGGRVISDETGTKLENATLDSGIIGQAKRVVVTKENTMIIDGFGNKEAIEERAESIRKQITDETDEFAKTKLHERLARLTSGIGVISVGAITKAEQKELRDRVDDAFAASKAALREGVVAGGGAALLAAKRSLDNWHETKVLGKLIGDEDIGVSIVYSSLESPIRKILENAGIDASMIVSKLLESNDSPNYGYNVLTKKFVNMIEDGVIDPAEVVINEIQNAASVAGLLLTTECLICEEPKKEQSSCNC